jgi:hypothetical protein
MRNSLLKMLIVLLAIGTTTWAKAQVCTPDPLALIAGIPGVYPSPLPPLNQDQLAAGQQGDPYSQTFTFLVPADTTIDLSSYIGFPFPPVTLSVNYLAVTGITGAAPGLNYACDPANCQFPGGSNGCALLSGTPTQGGLYNVVMNAAFNYSVPQQVPVIGGQALDIPFPGLEWEQNIQAVGVKDVQSNSLSIGHNSPNPFHGVTQISYNSPKPAAISFVVMDLTGKVMHDAQVRAVAGENVISFDATDLAAGIYLYRLSNGEKSVTSKMVVE